MTGGARPDVAAVVLAAGSGTRLRPLTELRPKGLCPVNNVALVDHAVSRVAPVTDAVAVNVSHHRAQLEAHLAGRVHVSVEEPEALETAGALGLLKGWLDGRHVLTVNVDAWHPTRLEAFAGTWDGDRPRVLCVRDPARGDFGDLRYAGVAVLPWRIVANLPAERLGLYPSVLGPAWERGELERVAAPGPYFDCGTPGEYLAANLTASGGASVVGEGAVVAGELVRSVVWPGARVGPDERLVDAVRADGLTVEVDDLDRHLDPA